MRIGVPKESKDREFRVGMTPDGVLALVKAGHEIWVEQGAGLGSGFSDDDYRVAGAELVDRKQAWSEPELIVKVKEPDSTEVGLLQPDQVLFTYLHLAAAPGLTDSLCNAGVRAIAYETVRDADGSFPILAPMSEVAGRLAAQIGASLLQKDRGGKGLLLGGVPGVGRGRVTILGAGTVGINALRVAHAFGAEVDVFDLSLPRLSYVYDLFRGELNTLYSNPINIERSVRSTDLLIGAVYIHGRRPPILVDKELVAQMEPGSVIIDVAVDQGGCVETIHATTHSDPTYDVGGVVHYGVANKPGAVARTATFAMSNAPLPLIQELAERGVDQAVQSNPALALGASVWRGEIVCEGVAESLELPYRDLHELLPAA
jgi:alanine dehydrogenase